MMETIILVAVLAVSGSTAFYFIAVRPSVIEKRKFEKSRELGLSPGIQAVKEYIEEYLEEDEFRDLKSGPYDLRAGYGHDTQFSFDDCKGNTHRIRFDYYEINGSTVRWFSLYERDEMERLGDRVKEHLNRIARQENFKRELEARDILRGCMAGCNQESTDETDPLLETKKQAAREGYIAAAMYFGYPRIDEKTIAECASGWAQHKYGGDDE